MQNNKGYFFSLIIPHINEGYLLNIMLDSIYNYIHYDNYEIIIIDDGSENKTDLEFCKSHFLKNKINIYFRKGLGVAGCKILGAKKAKGDVFFFLDAHMYFNNDILEKVDFLLNKYKEIDLLQAILTSHKHKNVFGSIYKISNLYLDSGWDDIDFEGKEIQETPNISGASIIIRSKVYHELGGFNKFFKYWGTEDLEMSFRAWINGYKCYIGKDLIIAHYFKDKLSGFNYNMKVDYLLRNKLIFLFTCFQNQKRIDKILNELEIRYNTIFKKIYDELKLELDFWNWIENERLKYKFNDDWYFEKFVRYNKEFII